MQPHTTTPARGAAVPGAAAIHRSRSALTHQTIPGPRPGPGAGSPSLPVGDPGGLSARLRRSCAAQIAAIRTHPWITGAGDGTLDLIQGHDRDHGDVTAAHLQNLPHCSPAGGQLTGASQMV